MTPTTSNPGSVVVREATEADVEAIRDIFRASYGEYYSYPAYYEPARLKRMIYGDDTLLLVAEDPAQRQVVGTASVIIQVGAYADLVGEFGRLAVHPSARGRGIGKLLMAERVRRVEKRLHLGLVENRSSHPYSQKISAAHGFVPLGFIPLKLVFDRRESIALYGRHFGDALELRRNHPRIIAEVDRVAHLALSACGLADDTIIEGDVAPYEHDSRFELQELTTEGYTRLLRLQRGRIKQREVFGPIRLHYGLFQLEAKNSNYLIAKQNSHIVGGLGYLVDPHEQAVRIFEIVAADERPIYFLLDQLVQRCQNELNTALIEIDVSAYAPRMQRTLIEFDFLPVAYIPAMVFHDVERLDAVKMVRLLIPCDIGEPQLHDATKPIADAVIRSFVTREVQPRIAAAVPTMPLFRDLNRNQAKQLAAICQLEYVAPETVVFEPGEPSDRIYIVLEGRVSLDISGPPPRQVIVHSGECFGEMSLLRATPHTARAVAMEKTELATISHRALLALTNRRPDIGTIVFRNLARGLTEKLAHLGEEFADFPQDQPYIRSVRPT